MKDYDLSAIAMSGASGLDALFEREKHILKPAAYGRRKVASMKDLSAFIRTSAETLVHKSERDLWALKKEADGQYFVERLFDDAGEPLKG
jgi:hypothetical protein